MKNNTKHFVIVALLVAVSSVLIYLLLTSIYQLPVAASEEADSIAPLFDAHFMMISFLFALIMVIMIYSVFVFRRKPGDESDGAHFHGHTGLEVFWTIVPLGTVIAFGVWGALVLTDITETRDDEFEVNVIGRQWSWVFSYPDYEEVGTVDVLALPVNRVVRLKMTSQDVLHSFWVPEFRVKQDLIPGTETTLRITPTREDSYKVRCAEICGFDHSAMLASVLVLSQSDFDQWIADRSLSLANLSAEERGGKWATDYACVSCHSLDGSDKVGPTWLGLFGREETLDDGSSIAVDDAYLTESILDPGAKIVSGFTPGIMPSDFGGRFTADEAALLESQGIEVDIVADLIAFIRTLEE